MSFFHFRRVRRRPHLLIAMAALGAAACVTLPEPTPDDARRAQERWPEATLGELAKGRERYVARCSGCHTLHLPEHLPPEKWPKALDDMQDEAKLTPEDRARIEWFLVTLAGRPRG